MSEAQYLVWCDGGCSNNGTQQAQGYASYSLETRTGKRQVARLTELPGVSTNNQAEYVALVSALVDLRGRIERPGTILHGYTVVRTTSSYLLDGQLIQGWQIQATKLRLLVNEAAALIQTFSCCNLVKVPHDEILRVHRHLTEQIECQLDHTPVDTYTSSW